MLKEQERERYSRQLIIDGFGEEGQERLAAGKVLVVGAGGLGSAAAYYLAAAGVGTIGIIDDQDVELSNLQRQILHDTGRIGMSKAESAKMTLSALNPEIEVIPYDFRLTAANARELVERYDIVVAALDNEETRYLINEVCVTLRKPLVEGGVLGFSGRLMTVLPGVGPCYACVFPPSRRVGGEEPDAGGPLPVLSTSPGIIGVLQAHEVLKLLLKVGNPLVGRMLFFDGMSTSFHELEVKRAGDCPCCSLLRGGDEDAGAEGPVD